MSTAAPATPAVLIEPVVGVIGAMEVEVDLLKAALVDRHTDMRAGMEFSVGTLGGTRAVVARCGVGKVNAALCVQVLADLYGVTHVVNTGVAGSLDASIDIGDLVVSTDALHHDMDVTALGYAAGQVPGLSELAFPADPDLRARVARAAAAAAPELGVFEGRVVSGDRFVADRATKQRLAEGFGGRCCEMEGAAIAQACRANSLPFVIVRAISDKADGSDEELYPVFEEKAARHCAAIVEQVLADFSA